MQRTDHLVHVDTAFEMSETEHSAIKTEQLPAEYREMMFERRSKIALRAHEFLSGMQVPIEAQFSDLNYFKFMKMKTKLIN